MALKWGEIQDLRSRVPREYQPWLNAPASPGLDNELGADAAVGEVDNRARETDRTIYNLGMNATRVGNFMATGAMMTRIAQTEQASQEERRKDDKFALDRAREALERRIAQLEADLAASEQRETQYRAELEALEEIRRRKALGQKIDDDLLRRAGLTREEEQRDDFDDVVDAKADQRRDDIDREVKTQGDLRGRIARERDLARRYDEGDPQARAEVQRLAPTTDGARVIGGAAFNSDRQETRDELADAIGAHEVAAVRAASAQDNESAVQVASIQQLSSADASNFDFDAPASGGTATASAASAIAPTTAFSTAPNAGAAFATATGQAGAAAPSQQFAENDITAPDTGASRVLLPRNG